MLTVSGVCTCGRCDRSGRREIYRMAGSCYNCTAKPILMLYRAGDKACPLDCPACGNYQSVHPSRLATDDEIPAAEGSEVVRRLRADLLAAGWESDEMGCPTKPQHADAAVADD